MEFNDELIREAYTLWEDFKKEILNNNRFIIKHKVLDYVSEIAEKSKRSIVKNAILYRARIFNGDDSFLNYLNYDFSTITGDKLEEIHLYFRKGELEAKKVSGFWGYDAEDSFVPQDNNLVGDGRANPSRIKYLYCAESDYSALAEVRPHLGANVSVAQIKVNEELLVADFTFHSIKDLNTIEDGLLYFIMADFAKPIGGDTTLYVPTQYIAEFIKNLGFEGIRFNSSLHQGGYNVTIFNYAKCSAVSSKLYKISDICIESECLAPKGEKGLIHDKLIAGKADLTKKLRDAIIAQETKKGTT